MASDLPSEPPPPTSPGQVINGTPGYGFGGWSWLAAAIFLFGIVLAVTGRPIYLKYRQHQAREAAQKIMVAIDEERWEAASQMLGEALPRNREHPQLLRAMAEFCMKAYGDAQMAVTPLRQILIGGQATDDDARRLAEVLILTGDLIEARRIYDALPQSTRDSRLGLELLAQITRESGNPAEAERLLRQALSRSPDDPECQLRLALLDENASLEATKQQAAAAIWALARRKDRHGLNAISHLATQSVLTATSAAELRRLVEAHPLTTDRDRYRVLHAFLLQRPLDRRALVAEEMKRNKDRAPEALFDFLRWLGTEKEAAAILTILPKETAIRDSDIFLVYADALSAAERWAELRDIITQERVQIGKATASYILAQCYARLEPDLYKARQYIISTYGHASLPGEHDLVFRTALLAENSGLFDIARQGYQKVADAKPRNLIIVIEKLHELATREKDIPGMFASLRRLRELRPGSQSYIDRLNYLRLVTGEEMEEAWLAVNGFADIPASKHTSSAVHPALLRALAAYRLGQPERISAELPALRPIANQLPAGQRAIVAGLLRLAGDDITAFRLDETVPKPLLLEEEKLFAARMVD